jgi:hypothetical protein
VWYLFVFSLFLLELGTRPTVWYFKNKEIQHCWPSS